jgi:hypothetical protein
MLLMNGDIKNNLGKGVNEWFLLKGYDYVEEIYQRRTRYGNSRMGRFGSSDRRGSDRYDPSTR